MDGFSLFFATSGPTKRRKHYFCLLFSQYWTGVQQKVNVLLTSPSNQFRDYFIWNRMEKLMPQLWNFSPQTLKTFKQVTNLFSNLDFLPKSWFPKKPGFVHGFSMEAGLSRPGSLAGLYCIVWFFIIVPEHPTPPHPGVSI